MSPPDRATGAQAQAQAQAQAGAGAVVPRAVRPAARPAWYALERGGWRDYVTLLHPPYTAWHLSYVVIGGCLAPVGAWQRPAPVGAWGRLGAAVAAFALAVGVGAHALDELHGRPLRTRIPDRVLVALAAGSLVGAAAIGVVGAAAFQAWLALLVPLGLFLVLAYSLELGGGRFHSDVWFGLAWGGFPVLCGYAAVAGDTGVAGGIGIGGGGGVTVLAAVLAAGFAVLLSLAQRVLSSHVRYLRRRVRVVRGELELADGSRQPLDARRLTAAAEAGLRLLSLATVVLAATLAAFRV